jgi:hypothetical protein
MIPLRFVVRTVAGGGAAKYLPQGDTRCYLRVELSDGTEGRPWTEGLRYRHTHTFETMFADCHHLWNYLQTPLFENEPLDWDGRVGTIAVRMHESTYGHPTDSEGGPDAVCFHCERYFWSGDPDADPDKPVCPTCYAKIRHRFEAGMQGGSAPNPGPDERGRRAERALHGGDVHDRARALSERVRRGEVPMSHVALACALAGRRDACLLDPPPYDHQYLLADRRDLVRWAWELSRRVIPSGARSPVIIGSGHRQIQRLDLISVWLQGGRAPRAEPSLPRSSSGPGGIAIDAIRMIRSRSNHVMHALVKGIIKQYRVRVYQMFMFDMGGSSSRHAPTHKHGRESPAWTLADAKGPVIEVEQSPRPGRLPTVRYDQLRLRNAAQRQATDLLGRILLREQ